MSIDITPTTLLAPFEAEHQAVDLTRNTKGSRWDRIGNNELIAADQFRYNYNPDSGIFEGRTIMGQWTNEILDPRDMTTGEWTKQNITVANVSSSKFDGDETEITEDSSDSQHRIYQDYIGDSGQNYTIRATVKANGRDWIRFRIYGTDDFPSVWFNVSNGSVGTVQSGYQDAEINDIGDGYYECKVTRVVPAGENINQPQFFLANGDGVDSYQGDGSSGVKLPLIEIFEGNEAPPVPVYGETAGQSYTQDPDIAKVTDLSWFNPDEGTIVIHTKGVPNKSFSSGGFRFDDGTNGNRIAIFNDGNVRPILTNNGNNTILNLGDYPDNAKIAVSYSLVDQEFTAHLNGATSDTSNTDMPSNISQLLIGEYSGNYLDGFIKGLKYYPRRLSNAKLQQLTS